MQKKLLLFLLLTIIRANSQEEAGEEDEQPEEEEEEEEKENWIDTGCIKSRPALCPDGVCYADYSSCEPLDGCTNPKTSLMCPSGICVSNFEECANKSYQCAISSLNLCSDGFCRENCEGIQTNGCTPDSPFFCANGKCVKYAAQCIDYRCSIERPFICNDLKCVPNFMSCSTNHLSYMIDEKSDEITVNTSNRTKITYSINSKLNKNEKSIAFSFENNYLIYNEFTAGFASMNTRGIEEFELTLSFKPVPKSIIANSKIKYEETNLDTEKLSNLIFSKEYGYLDHTEFIRSSIVQIELEDFEYNHFFFGHMPTTSFRYNKIDKYPDFSLTQEEIDTLNNNFEGYYDINDPNNYYCLGIFNEDADEWSCISRNIVDINENVISFKVPFPGIYSIIFFPINTDNIDPPCGFVCEYKKIFYSLLLIIIPVTFLIISYILDNHGDLIEEMKKKISNLGDNFAIMDLKNLKNKFKKKNKKAKNQEEVELKEEDLVENENYEILLKEPDEDINPLDLIDENFDVKGNIQTFSNPLIFNQKKAENDEEQIKKNLESEKVHLKFKSSVLLESKIKLLKKLTALNSEKQSLKKDIEKLKSLQGINAIYEEDNNQDI